jgi:probable HAF family extracellular repeat protein
MAVAESTLGCSARWQRDMTRTILTMPIPDWMGFAQAISNTGFVAGYFDNNRDGFHCFVWTPDARSIDLGGDEHNCVAHDVNDFGHAIGEAEFSGHTHAFLWKGGTMHDLGPNFRISLVLRSSRTSRSNSLMRCCSVVAKH